MAARLTTESWTARARAVHGDRFDYSLVEYVNSTTKVTIICREHGPFEQRPVNHLRGQGCSRCSGTYRPSTEEYVARAQAVHGDCFDYSQTVYVNDRTKITVICREHGPFEVSPYSHLHAKHGCPVCAKAATASRLRHTTSEFIRMAQAVHGDRYDYSRTKHTSLKAEITIICPVHGAFEQQAGNHLKGAGCAECAGLKKGTTEEFIERARETHGDRYNYSQVEYVNRYSKVAIVCRRHGAFEQRPYDHIAGRGCWRCVGLGYKPTSEEYIERAREIHGDFYDYSLTEYTVDTAEVVVICPEHGDFKLKAGYHTRGRQGCPSCTASVGETAVRAALDALGIAYECEWTHESMPIRGRGRLRFDFHLPDYQALIEFDGRQHFEPVKWNKSVTDEEAQEQFEATQRRDRIKNEWAEANGYRLLRASDLTTVVDEVVGFIAELERSTEINQERKAA